MLSFQAEQALGRPLWEMTREPVIQALVDRALKERQSIRQDIEIQGKAPRSVSLYVSPLETIDTATVILVIHDISELRRLEQLRQDFVANVSHELKTPLAVIKVCVENLLDGAMHDPSVGESFLTQISDQAERLHTLILDLISLARIESGQMQMDYQDLPVKAVVMDCLDQQRSRAEAKKITLQVDTPEHEQFVLADEEALGQILSNLIDNALKYTPDSGRIAIRWQPSGDGVELSVSDNGTGIPERDLPRIFERFYRVDRARSRELGGTGLGLAIVKHLVQTMKGTVKAQSELGKGSTFTIWLPRANA
jgi:two-component system phosphate regulon sensor histidine kinase PhoR